MAVVFVRMVVHQSSGSGTTSFTTSTTLAGAVTAGNFLVALVNADVSENIATFADSVGTNTWAKAKQGSSSYWQGSIWYVANSSAITTAGTFTSTTSNSRNQGITVLEFSGMGSTPTVSDTGNFNQSSGSTTWTDCSSGGTTVSGDLVIFGAATDNGSGTATFTAGTFGDDNSSFNGGNPGKAMAYILSASGATQTFHASWTSSGDGNEVIACFTPSGGGGGGLPFFMNPAMNEMSGG